MNKTGVYIVRNKLDGKTYVGKSWDSFSTRKNSHFRCGTNGDGDCRCLYNAMKCHGVDNFEFIILHVITPETHGENFKQVILDTEIKEQIERNTLAPNGYNLVIGDPRSKNGIIEMSEETRQLKSEAMKGENNHMFGKPRTEEVKQKLRIANTGKKYPPRGPEYSAKMSELNRGENHPMFGKTHKEESKKAIGDKIRGRKESAETKAKKSAALKGIKRSAETKAKLSKKVEQWSSDGKTLIRTFPSVAEVTKITSISSSHISQVANNKPGHKTASGFIWKWANSDK